MRKFLLSAALALVVLGSALTSAEAQWRRYYWSAPGYYTYSYSAPAYSYYTSPGWTSYYYAPGAYTYESSSPGWYAYYSTPSYYSVPGYYSTPGYYSYYYAPRYRWWWR
jgi:hypothetical protein